MASCKSFADLWSSEAYTWCIGQRLAHMLDQFMNPAAANLFLRKRPRLSPQNSFSDTSDLDSHLGYHFPQI
jgi:hypothetical protein